MESLFGAALGGLVAAEDERSELTKRALESLLVFQVCRRRVALFQCFLKQIFWFEFLFFNCCLLNNVNLNINENCKNGLLFCSLEISQIQFL